MTKPVTPEPILRMLNGIWLSQTLAVSVELEIFTKIDKGINTIQSMAESLHTAERPMEALLNACLVLELLKRQDGVYSNTELADTFLVRGKPKYYGDFVEMLSKRSFITWRTLKESILANYPQEETLDEAFQRDPSFAVLFTKAMHNNAIAPALMLPTLFDFSKCKQILDLGGGSGIYSIMLAKKYPNLNAIVIDFPTVCEVAQEYIQKFAVSSQVSTLSGNFFKIDLPKNVDVVILGQILHSYSVLECKRIIELSRNALVPGGLIIITDFYLNNDKKGPLYPALFALNMIVGSKAGNAYSLGEVTELLHNAGFQNVENKHLLGPISLLSARKT